MALPGLPSQEASGRDRSTPNTRWPIHFRSGFSKAVQRFNAGWSSPVARQAHNLKVIGSNPIPATKLQCKTPALAAGVFVWGNPSSRQRVMSAGAGDRRAANVGDFRDRRSSEKFFVRGDVISPGTQPLHHNASSSPSFTSMSCGRASFK